MALEVCFQRGTVIQIHLSLKAADRLICCVATTSVCGCSENQKAHTHIQESIMIVSHILAKIRSYLRYRDTVRELSRLTDRELNDLGLSRWDIPFIARKHTNVGA